MLRIDPLLLGIYDRVNVPSDRASRLREYVRRSAHWALTARLAASGREAPYDLPPDALGRIRETVEHLRRYDRAAYLASYP